MQMFSFQQQLQQITTKQKNYGLFKENNKATRPAHEKVQMEIHYTKTSTS